MISLVLAATLSFTLPSTTQLLSPTGTVTNCGGGAPLKNLAGYRIYAQTQSATWNLWGAQMKASDDLWAQLWPSVRAQASPQLVREVSTRSMPNRGVGQRITTTAPDSIGGMPVLQWWVETFNDSGRVSCPSNPKVRRP